MGSFALTISADELATLQNVPQQIATLANTAQQSLAAVRSGANAGNPVGALFSGLQTLGNEAAQLPAIEPLIAPIRDLASQLPASALADVQAIGAEIEKVMALFGPLKDGLLSGGIDQDVTGFIEKTIGDLGSLFKPGEEVTSLLGELEQFLKLFKAMLGWKDSAPNADDVAALIARGLAGMAPDLLSGATAALNSVLAPLAAIVPSGDELTRWRAVPTQRLALWQDISARVGGTVDWATLEASLHVELGVLIELKAVRDHLLQASLGNLARIDLRGIAAVATKIKALPQPRDFRLTPILSGLRNQLASTAERIEAWEPSEDDILKLVRGLVDQLLAYVENSPLGQLRTLLVNFQQRILHAIEALPFRDLAQQAEAALRKLADAVQVIDPDLIKKPVHEFFTGIETKLDAFSDNAVLDAIGSLWSGVADALNQIGAQIQTLRTTLDGLTAQLQTLAQNVQPALTAISDSVATVDTALGNFDLEQPAQAVIGELNKLRDKVAALDVSNLPEPAVAGLKAGAEFLRNLDLAGTINPPLNDVLKEIDPTALIQQAADKIGAITAQLKQLDPAVLTRDLDKPVDDLLAEFSKIGPEQFSKLLKDALQPVTDAIHSLDFSELLAPITRIYAELAAKVDAILNPDVIFAPLEALFKPITDVIDALQPTRFIQLLEPHSDSMVSNVGGAAAPPAIITGANLQAAMPAGPEADDDLFGFRIGDMLVPLIDLHRQLTQAFNSLDNNVLSAAAASLRAALQGGLDALNPLSISAHIDTALVQVHLEFEPAQISAQLSAATLAYHDAVGAIASAAALATAPNDAATSTRVLALLNDMNPLVLVPESAQFDGVFSASLQVQANLDLSAFADAAPALAQIQELLPEFLRVPELTSDAIRQALQDLDPAPLRIEINTLFDRIGKRIVALQHIVAAAFEELGRIAEEFILPVTPSALAHVADNLHAALKQQVQEFSPTRFKDEVTLIFDVVKRQLGAFDPVIIVNELNGLRDALIQQLNEMVTKLLPDPAPFHELQDQMAQLKPSQLLAPLVQTLQPISDLVAKLDVHVLFQPLIDAIARIRDELPTVVAEVEAALDEVLAAFPEGGIDSASVSVSASASVG
ncbi:MAG: hypothetical protein JWM78_2112 [Verrucomicrobiaceae bacterium]|nr:hypothetical protein [Verrucomicrobiaceae bacterium]